MDSRYPQDENFDRMQPIGVEFNMGYIFAATAIAGTFVAIMIYWLMSNTKRSVPNDFVSSSQYSSSALRATPAGTSRGRTSGVPTRQAKQLLAKATQAGDNDITDEDSEEARERLAEEQAARKKIGVKKAAKLEMKAEKRAAREAMLIEREEKKREQEFMDQLRKEEEEKQRKEEEEKEEQERLIREEQARKEHEAYLEMAAKFDVEEEGYDPENDVDSDAKLAEFISYVKEQKVVLLEQLAGHFKMKAKDVVDRIQKLIQNGSLVGIIDDRGKFISITDEELSSVAKFIRQRGRVRFDELVINSNKLMNLKPEVEATT